MHHISPLGPVYQAGTLSGNPIAMSAGLATLELISATDFYTDLTAKTEYLLKETKVLADKHNIGFTSNQVGAMFGMFFTDQSQVTCFSEVMKCDTDRFGKFFHGMLDNGIYLAPSAFEAGFVSSAHSQEDLDATLTAIDKVFATL